jgi:hypothetical protein
MSSRGGNPPQRATADRLPSRPSSSSSAVSSSSSFPFCFRIIFFHLQQPRNVGVCCISQTTLNYWLQVLAAAVIAEFSFSASCFFCGPRCRTNGADSGIRESFFLSSPLVSGPEIRFCSLHFHLPFAAGGQFGHAILPRRTPVKCCWLIVRADLR